MLVVAERGSVAVEILVADALKLGACAGTASGDGTFFPNLNRISNSSNNSLVIDGTRRRRFS